MKRLSSLFVTATVLAAPVFAHSGLALHHRSPHSPLEYEYATESGDPDGLVTKFEIATPYGTLAGEIERHLKSSRLSLAHRESGDRSELSHTKTGVPGIADVHLSFPERRQELRFTEDTETGSLHLVHDDGPDCEEHETTDFHLAQAHAVSLFAADYEIDSITPEAHLMQVFAALYFSGGLVAEARGCGGFDDLLGGACYYDHKSYDGCVDCCDTGIFPMSLWCRASRPVLCNDPWCAGVSTLVCNRLSRFEENWCVNNQCLGKPGDPRCTTPLPCELIGGSCQVFCGMTDRGACGTCNNYYQDQCCVPR